MSTIELSISFPLDEDRFLRRECPYCCKEFKVKVEEEQLVEPGEQDEKSFMTEPEPTLGDEVDEGAEELEHTCPYCGQKAPGDHWWTQAQLELVQDHQENVMADLVNEHFIRPMKKMSQRSPRNDFIRTEFKGKEIEQSDPWMAPEVNDMKLTPLSCCNEELKIDGDWSETVYCYYCGFPHNIE